MLLLVISRLNSAVEVLLDIADFQTPMEIHGSIVTPAQIFAPLLGNFDYLSPGLKALSSLNGQIATSGDNPRNVGAGELLSNFTARVSVPLSAGVDDSRISRTLFDGRVLTEGLLVDGSVDTKTRSLLTRFLTYSETSMFRRKNVLPVWKTESHFSDIAFDLGETLRDSVVDAIANLNRGDEWKQALRQRLTDEVGDLESSLTYEQSGALFNWIMALVLGHTTQRLKFEGQLDETWPGQHVGYWRCAPTNFTALARGRKAGIVWDEQGKPMKLSRASALISGLERVERQRNQFAFFFFLEFPNSMADWDDVTVRGMRYLMTDHLKKQFPLYAGSELPINLVSVAR